MAKKKRKIAVIDFETDPFLHGRLPIPFAWGFYDGERYVDHWQEKAWDSNECVNVLVNFLLDQDESYLILAHNGGKFDFLFFIERLEGTVRIVNGRILQAQLGQHTIRDSYAILPIPLAQAGGKLEIDYKLMEREVREDHREEILTYLKADCISLYQLCEAFYDEFEDALTIGSVAMKQLKKFHPYDTFSPALDKMFRQYYYGGRCQCFEVGVIDAPIDVHDLNSSYPFTMKSMLHPVSTEHWLTSKIGPNTAFVTWEGENYNAVPTRTKTGLDFTVPAGVFYSTVHEFNAGLETGTIAPKRIIEAVHFEQLTTFDSFIEHFYTSRLKAKADGDLFHDIFYKLVLNSAYGKFAQSPDNFEDSVILPYGDIAPEGYEIRFTHGKYAIWAKPSNRKTYFNVATAASITGGSRATLLRGLASTVRPLYCDTDSIFSVGGFTGNIDNKQLGAWKHEYTGSQMAIAGKKLYALMGEKDGQYSCLKKASKGTQLNPLAIFMIARGDTCETRNDAPSFKLDGKHEFIRRNIRRTTLGRAA
jgi:hypothetical protein